MARDWMGHSRAFYGRVGRNPKYLDALLLIADGAKIERQTAKHFGYALSLVRHDVAEIRRVEAPRDKA